MSDITEGLGTAVEGGLAARAVEQEAGSQSAARDGTCLNCGSELTGAHCAACGQKATLHRSLRTIAHDLVHGVLHLDGKSWRTLPLLAWKPGHLTRRYIAGERAKFVSPMAMFLFSVFLMFAVFQALGITTPTDFTLGDDVEQGLDIGLEKAETEFAKSQAALGAMPADDPARAQKAEEVAGQRVALETARKLREAAGEEAEGFGSAEFDLSGSGTGSAAIDNALIQKWREDPGLIMYKLQTNAYKFSWLLIPISIPFVWVLFFWKRRFKAYDHAIFVTYSLSFMTLLFVVLSLLGTAGAPVHLVALSAIFVPLIHIYRQLRGAYELRRLSALWRTLVLTNVIIFVVISAFLWLLVLLGAL